MFLLGVASVVRNAVQDALVKILTPKKPVNVLRDALAARSAGQPFVITFCGVNGVGKSTNLAKVRRCSRMNLERDLIENYRHYPLVT